MTEAAAYRIDYVRPEDLPPDPRNAKGHDKEKIRRSIADLGFIEPPTIDERTGLLISGHGRRGVTIELEEAGGPPPFGVRLDGDGRWVVPVVRGWESRDDDHAAAALIVLNRSGEAGGWRADALMEQLEHLDRSDVDLELTGYSRGDLDRMLAELRPEPPEEFPPVDPDEMGTEYKCPRCSYEWSGKAR